MTNIKFEPFGPRIVVKVDETVVKKGDIITPDIAKKEGVTGRVMAISQKLTSSESDHPIYPIGARVRFLAHTGNEIEVDGVKYLVLDEHCVLGRFTQ